MSNSDRATSLTKPLEQRKPARRRRKPDRRIESTRNRPGNALIALIEEKPIDEVTVREVLDRAGVGRYTFYVHYSDKEDLFLSVLEQGLELWTTTLSRQQEKSNRVCPGGGVLCARRLGKEAISRPGQLWPDRSILRACSRLLRAGDRATYQGVTRPPQPPPTRIDRLFPYDRGRPVVALALVA